MIRSLTRHLPLLLLVACSGAEGRHDTGFPGDDAGAGARSGGAAGVPTLPGVGGSGGGGRGGAGGAIPTPTATETGACIEYLRAQCERRVACGTFSDFDGCFFNVSQCPDFLFSPGTTRTIAGTVACADEWRAASCADLAVDKLPPCVSAGSRVPGEPCVFGAQCASRVCATTGGGCGTCTTLARLGEPCGSAEISCADGLVCDSVTELCSPVQGGPAPTPIAALGELCGGADGPSCGQNDCRAGADGVYRCALYPRLGESCLVPKTCAFDDVSYCDISQTCLAKPGEGQPCGVDAFTGQPSWCAAGTACTGASPTPVCRALPALGAACTVECVGDAVCTCTDEACTARACQNHHLPGEPCDTARGEACFGGVSRCEGGVCVANGSQGLFQTRCGP